MDYRQGFESNNDKKLSITPQVATTNWCTDAAPSAALTQCFVKMKEPYHA
jgi:hypothetical protein